MTKLFYLLLCFIMSLSLVACKATTFSNLEPTESTRPELDVKQALIDICGKYSDCNSLRGFTIEYTNKQETSEGYIVQAAGFYWPVDIYGEINAKNITYFDIEFTATWDEKSQNYNILANNNMTIG